MNEKDVVADKRLVELAQRDRKNFAGLYEKYYKQILNYIRKRIENHEISEDLTSRVFEKALKAIDNYQWQGIPFSSWLFRIARNVLNDYYRFEGRRETEISVESVDYMLKDKEPIPDEQLLIDEDERKLYEAIADLPSDDQYLLFYKFFEGLTNVEISKITGITETNVGTRLYRIRSKMKEILEETAQDFLM